MLSTWFTLVFELYTYHLIVRKHQVSTDKTFSRTSANVYPLVYYYSHHYFESTLVQSVSNGSD